jgi:hypothetical protein
MDEAGAKGRATQGAEQLTYLVFVFYFLSGGDAGSLRGASHEHCVLVYAYVLPRNEEEGTCAWSFLEMAYKLNLRCASRRHCLMMDYGAHGDGPGGDYEHECQGDTNMSDEEQGAGWPLEGG